MTVKKFIIIGEKPVAITALDKLLSIRRTMQLHINSNVKSLGFDCVSKLLTQGVPEGDFVPKEHRDFLEIHYRFLGIINSHLEQICISKKVFESYYKIIKEEKAKSV